MPFLERLPKFAEGPQGPPKVAAGRSVSHLHFPKLRNSQQTQLGAKFSMTLLFWHKAHEEEGHHEHTHAH